MTSQERITTQQLVAHYLLGIRGSAHKEYEAFLEAFDVWATEVTVAVTEAQQHEILQQQGRAQAYLHMLRVFKNPQDFIRKPTPPSA